MKELEAKNPHKLRIDLLPEHIIDQIKAGEVLERPGSLVKELLENALDAKATKIDIHLVDNGMEFLSIIDNGIGMSVDELPYAFARHATSKIKNYEDLFRLHTYGFRGEALASLAASARVICHSQPKDLNVSGGKIVISGGQTELLIPEKKTQNGTSIFIRDLFYNTPARLKFIKSKNSEKSHLKKIINSFLLSHAETDFTVKWDDKEKEVYKKVSNIEKSKRVEQVFFGHKNSNHKTLYGEREYEGHQVKVFFTKETYSSPQYRHHYLFANDRFFIDKNFHQIILRALSQYWQKGESGHYLVEIKTPLDEIDVNVHPNKTQIKFMRTDVLASLLTQAIKSALEKTASENSTPSALNESNYYHTAKSIEDAQDADLIFPQENFNFDRQTYSSTVERKMNSNDILFDKYLFYLNDKAPYFVDLANLIVTFATQVFKTKHTLDDLIPLIISEPFSPVPLKIDRHFEEMKVLGLEFDRLNSNAVILRAHSESIPHFLVIPIAKLLIKYFANQKNEHYSESNFIIFLKNSDINTELNQAISNLPLSFIHDEINNYFLSKNNLPSDIFCYLNPVNIKKLFQTNHQQI